MEKYTPLTYLNKKFLSIRIRKKLFLCFLLLTAVSIAAIVVITAYVSNGILRDTADQYLSEFLQEYSQNLEYRTRNMLDNTYQLMSDEAMIDLLRKADRLDESFSIALAQKEIREIGRTYLQTRGEIEAFYLLDTRNQVYWCRRYSKNAAQEASDTEHIRALTMDACERLEQQTGEKVWYESSGGQLLLARTLFDPGRIRKRLATIVFLIDSALFDGGNQNKGLNSAVLGYGNQESHAVFADAEFQSLITRQLDLEQTGLTLFDLDGYHVLSFNREDTIWKVFCFVPGSYLTRNWRQLLGYILIADIISMIGALLISYYLSGNMTKNINTLEKSMQRVEEGDFNIRIRPASYDEIGTLCLRFNYMADKIEQLIEHEKEEYEERQKLQIQMLKAQIHPHFLYNSLGSIKCLAHIHKEEDIADMTDALINLLRASLSQQGEYHSVREEMDYLRNYFLLQSYRYGDLYQVIYEEDPEANECIVPDFILQPLAENALFHGIDMTEGNGVIWARSRIEGETLILEIEDNGVGMTEQKMQEIVNNESRQYDGLNNIGVGNVHARIRYYYGENYGLFYRKASGGGTVACARLPLRRN